MARPTLILPKAVSLEQRLTTADPKKHHFSAVFYLKEWCDPTDSKLVEYHRPYREVVARRVYPEATGFKHFLYSLEGVPDDQKQTIERDYMSSIVDNHAANALRILIANNPTGITEEVRNHWTRFLIASLVRRPQSVQEAMDGFRQVLKENLSDLKSAKRTSSSKQEGDPPTLYEWMEKNHADIVNDRAKLTMVSCIENQAMGNIIINMKWSVINLIKSQHDLLTSDAPHLRFYGLKDPSCLIAFPLSPRFLFVASHDGIAELTLKSLGGSKIAVLVNDNIVRTAERYVYGRTDSHLRFVENRLRRQPNV